MIFGTKLAVFLYKFCSKVRNLKLILIWILIFIVILKFPLNHINNNA